MNIPQIEAIKPVSVVVPFDEDDDPVATAYSQVDTQPLPKLQEPPFSWSLVVVVLLFYTSALGVAILYALTYPSVTIDVIPLEKVLSTTTMLPVPTRSLAPITLVESLTAKATGRGHFDATRASGTLTFYNGEFSAQTIVVGTIFTGSDGVQVVTERTVTISPAAPPFFGSATVLAHAIRAGAEGNIAAGDINTACCAPSLLVKNTSAFTGGRDTRDFQAVAQNDIDHLSVQLKQVLSQEIENVFPVQPGEGLFLSNCAFKIASNRQPGEEAKLVTVTVSHTCKGTAYNMASLQAQATEAISSQEAVAFGSDYLLVREVQATVMSVSPLLVRCSSIWTYNLTASYQRALINNLAGKTPQQAKTLLLRARGIQRVIVRTGSALPQDPDHIHLRVLIGL